MAWPAWDDEALHRSFLEKVPIHRELLGEWEQDAGKIAFPIGTPESPGNVRIDAGRLRPYNEAQDVSRYREETTVGHSTAKRRLRKGTTCRAPWIEIPIGEIHLVSPLHLADWPRRAEVVPGFAERVARVRTTGRWPGVPLRVRRQGEGYVLVSGFSRLAVAFEAGLPAVRAVVELSTREVPLSEVRLRPWQERACLNARKLERRLEMARAIAGGPPDHLSLPVPLVVRPARPEEPAGYILLDGLYWYHVALALARERNLDNPFVPVIVRG